MRTHVRPAVQCHPGRRRAATDERARPPPPAHDRQPRDGAPHPAQAGVTGEGRRQDRRPRERQDAAGWIQAAFEESEELKPYLKDKFPKSLITKDFDIHSDEDEFNEAAKAMKHNTEPMTKNQRAAAYGGIGGFFDRSTRHIHVRSRSKFGHAVHESMHKVAHPGFHGFWDDFINEGVTQYFADRLLVEHGLGVVTDHEYKDQLECAKKLVALTDWPTVAKAYFLNDGALREAVLKKLGTDLGTLRRDLNGDKVCARL